MADSLLEIADLAIHQKIFIDYLHHASHCAFAGGNHGEEKRQGIILMEVTVKLYVGVTRYLTNSLYNCKLC